MTHPRPGSSGSLHVLIRTDLTGWYAAFREAGRAFAKATRAAGDMAEALERIADANRTPAERRRRARRRARLAVKNPTQTALWTQCRAKTRRRNRKARR